MLKPTVLIGLLAVAGGSNIELVCIALPMAKYFDMHIGDPSILC